MTRPEPPETCCICREPIVELTARCYLDFGDGKCYFHHFGCGHDLTKTGTPNVPQIMEIIAMHKLILLEDKPRE